MPSLMTRPVSDDPRRLRELMHRTRELATDHEVPSVLVGFTAPEGDLLFPDFIAYVESELRVEDAIFRLTRERSVLFLADVSHSRAETIIERLAAGFRDEFPTAGEPRFEVRYYDVPSGVADVSVKQVLPALFSSELLD